MQDRSEFCFTRDIFSIVSHILLHAAADCHPERRPPAVRRVARDAGLHRVRRGGRDAEGAQAGATGGRRGPAEGTGRSHCTHNEPNTRGTRRGQ